jgi:O-antigen ligase
MTREPGNVATSAKAVLACALFAYPASMVIVPGVPGFALAVLLIGSTILLPVAMARRADLARAEDIAPVTGLFVFLAIGAAGASAWHAPTWLFVNYWRLFAALAIIGAIRLLRPPEWVFYAGCAVGALGAGALAIWQVVGEGALRASGPETYFGWQRATIFGALSTVLAFVPILADPPGWKLPGRLLLAAGLIGGVTAAVLSGSRGAWLACAVLALWRVGRGGLRAAALLLVGIIAASITLPVLSDRWDAAVGDIMLYTAGQSETSLGLRFSIWKAAAAAFAAHSLFGVGPTGFHDVLVERAQAGLASAKTLAFDHAHSDLMHVLATGGVVQLVGLVAAFWLPWRYFRRVAADRPSPAAKAGMAVIVGFVVLGLSDSMFVHRIALSAYVVSVAVLLGYAGVRGEALARRSGGLVRPENKIGLSEGPDAAALVVDKLPPREAGGVHARLASRQFVDE